MIIASFKIIFFTDLQIWLRQFLPSPVPGLHRLKPRQ